MGLNTLNEEGAKKYKSYTFTDEGYKILHNHTTQLVKWYMEKDRQYQFKIGQILGMPMFNYSQIIQSKELLLERIKILSTLLGVNHFVIKVGESAHTVFKLDFEEDKKDGSSN